MTDITIAWFSAGVSSAIATKLMIKEIDKIFYIHIEDQHHDTLRYVHDCEKWFGKPVEILTSAYKNVETACLMAGGKGYINGPHGAACTRLLKKRVRKEWEANNHFQYAHIRYVYGMDMEESVRCENLVESMPDFELLFPLIAMKITKNEAHRIMMASGIKRPAMYELGYHNNNCIGCVKGGMGYWNRIRRDFPAIFRARAEMERKIGATCINGTYLDELDPMSGRNEPPIDGDCGLFCEATAI